MSRKVAILSLWGAAVAVVIGTGAAAVALAQAGSPDRILSAADVVRELAANQTNTVAVVGADGQPEAGIADPATATAGPTSTVTPGGKPSGRARPGEAAPEPRPGPDGATTIPPTTSQGDSVIFTAGGTVTARCAAGVPQLMSWSPTPGFRVHDVERGKIEAKLKFLSEKIEIAVVVTCRGSAVTAKVTSAKPVIGEPVGD
ncbi:MAG: hypothetical protein HYR62_04705 [Actinobacteria bacterium]|nr:hypothetical protein [Actinomycetota bacterium]MBI3686481.1 hypothetical protein [Actinomycetota bacterium]